MPFRPWIITLPGFKIAEIREERRAIQVQAQSMTTRAFCPSCHSVSDRIHGYYHRTLKDLPIADSTMQLHLSVKRFRCLNRKCKQKTFVESLTGLSLKYAQRTQRSTCYCTALGMAWGGEAGQRAACQLHLTSSLDTCCA